MNKVTTSDAVTRGVKVTVEARYIEERSKPVDNVYFFAYKVTIANEGSEPAKLVSRHWVIENGNGEVEHIKGPGVVGEQPRLEPGHGFRYESFCPLPTPVGVMSGTYQMLTDTGETFDAEVAPFTLSAPRVLN